MIIRLLHQVIISVKRLQIMTYMANSQFWVLTGFLVLKLKQTHFVLQGGSKWLVLTRFPEIQLTPTHRPVRPFMMGTYYLLVGTDWITRNRIYTHPSNLLLWVLLVGNNCFYKNQIPTKVSTRYPTVLRY